MMVTPPQAAQALRATCTVDVGLLYLTHPLSELSVVTGCC